MEDAHTTLLDLLEPAELQALKSSSEEHQLISFFGVYDGHGGSAVAKYSKEHLHRNIAEDPEFKKGNFRSAIKNGLCVSDPSYQSDPSGCTAITTLITEKKIYCGNAGDSRAVLSRLGKAVPLSHDHKPVNPEEQARIKNAGGYVEFGRVNGNLALSRAIGDFEFKANKDLPPEQQIVTADPEIKDFDLVKEEDEFVVLACDGIWDCKSSEEVVEFVRAELAKDLPLKDIVENIMDECVAKDSELGGVGCDNMTIVIVAFLWGKSEDEWRQQIKARMEQTDRTSETARLTREDSEDKGDE
ncbi:Protein phosphatase 2C 2 [Phlyctochytrium bullatum]|nr:Protein phosphatase 2C 2 [Phlyctochytrium bullatum]